MSNLEQKIAEARGDIERAQTKLVELEKQLKRGGDSPVFNPTATYHYINGIGGSYTCTDVGDNAKGTNAAFRTEQAAKAHAEAFTVMLELRACHGVAQAMHALRQWVIFDFLPTRGAVRPIEVQPLEFKYGLSPCFTARQDAQAAIDKVGADRILKAMRTLAWAD